MPMTIGIIAFIAYSLALFRAGKTDGTEQGPMKAWAVVFVAGIVFGVCVMSS
ncbi:hypothetical protein PAQ31011_05126 [Pandoraea aquatica]|uniref:Uncharacterized protein n=1 Tax=Pandoraea aquatica TaxID=2508290 RepID=A0A5E4Z7K2_9BURK|nr:hypothetical protein [Pandoraea aquatica]VVE56647.1 hypothetical protein PAQ31011_05126 [Pandoraea aquatica]